ncbi:MAG: hypothetical protein ACI4P7_06935 [Bacilli bacterium]
MGGLIGSDFLTKIDPVGTGSFSLNGMAESDSGAFSVELGENTNAQGRASMAVGSNTVATAEDSFVCGRYNIIDQEGNKYVFIIGGGSAIGSERNLVTVDFDGNMNVSGTITDGNGNTFSDVLNFETLARMMTAGEHTGISITTETLEDGGHCFNFAITSLPEIAIDADGYWLMNGVRITDIDGQ